MTVGLKRWSAMATALVGFCLAGTTACNRRMLAAFFDVPAGPAPSATSDSARARTDVASPLVALSTAAAAPKPFVPFGGALTEDSAVPRLPRDQAGNVDWTAALRTGVIRPSVSLSGVDSAAGRLLRFPFDFNLPPGQDTAVVTWFPHTGHTEWMTCSACHARIFPYKRPLKLSMDALGEGKFCGECHGPVAFPIETGCERCHPRQEMPADEGKPVLLGTLRLRRVDGDTLDPPRAVFPHWVHRARFVCTACHDQLFDLKAGRAAVTMDLISQGKACGVCHDGKRAFAPDFGACERCHVPPRPTAKPE